MRRAFVTAVVVASFLGVQLGCTRAYDVGVEERTGTERSGS